MLTRSAIFEGTIYNGREQDFYDIIEHRLLPIWRRMPHVLDVRLFRPLEREPAAPQIILVQQIDYPSRAAMSDALNSSVRDEAVAASQPLEAMFDGRHYHYIYDRLA